MSLLSLSLPTMWAMLLRTSCSCAMAKNAIASMHFLRMSGARPISRQSLSCGVVAKVSCKQGFLAHAGRVILRFRATYFLYQKTAGQKKGAPKCSLALAQKTRLSAGCALDGFVGGKGVCPFPASHFAAFSRELVFNPRFRAARLLRQRKKRSTKVLPCAGAEDEIICGLRP